jgi:hypothetical protein
VAPVTYPINESTFVYGGSWWPDLGNRKPVRGIFHGFC